MTSRLQAAIQELVSVWGEEKVAAILEQLARPAKALATAKGGGTLNLRAVVHQGKLAEAHLHRDERIA